MAADRIAEVNTMRTVHEKLFVRLGSQAGGLLGDGAVGVIQPVVGGETEKAARPGIREAQRRKHRNCMAQSMGQGAEGKGRGQGAGCRGQRA